jgi:hypothetical protein
LKPVAGNKPLEGRLVAMVVVLVSDADVVSSGFGWMEVRVDE